MPRQRQKAKAPRASRLHAARRISPIIVILTSTLFVYLLELLRSDATSETISAAVFGASGTIVALALPAAELAGNSITRIGEYWIARFSNPSKEPPNKQFALGEIRKIKEKALTARYGSFLVLCAFIVSAISLLTRGILSIRNVVHLDRFLLGLSLGLLLVGVVFFFPFTWSVYRLDALRDAEDAIENFSDAKRTR